MSGISVSEDAVNLYYLMRLKSTVRLVGVPCGAQAWLDVAGFA